MSTEKISRLVSRPACAPNTLLEGYGLKQTRYRCSTLATNGRWTVASSKLFLCRRKQGRCLGLTHSCSPPNNGLAQAPMMQARLHTRKTPGPYLILAAPQQ
ncbi:hypothetical protein V5799_008611 [Amblyomma americanum]|uniref:Uncharacterized protein n=1 Tax=Amblyomma americanum TaxID=6943 RepID=A0AAQ4FED5_AMBAM